MKICVKADYNKTTIEMAFPDSIGIGMNFFIDNDTFFVKKINNKYVFQGDIILTDEQLKINSTLKGATMPNYNLWPNNTVFYIIHNNLDSKVEVLQAINHWNEKTTLNFIEWTGQENYIFIELGDGTYSNLGMIGGQQEIKIASNATLAMIIHEIGHAVGLIHEHSRSNRDDYIVIYEKNIKKEMLHNFEKKRNSVSQYDDFDFNSIMLYPCYSDASVAVDPAKPIITKWDGTFWNSRSKLSLSDINTIKFLYPPMNELRAFTDSRDGKTYKWVKIGDQTWMAENLAYLPSVSPSSQGSTTALHYYVYDYQGTDVAAAKQHANFTSYGVLYSWPAAMAGAASSSANPSKVQGVCPAGWHLPSDAEWKQLEMALGMTQSQADTFSWRGTDQGTQMKATNGWAFNGNGTNTSGFSALPGGQGSYNGFFSVGDYGFWWSSTEIYGSHAWLRYLRRYNADVNRSYSPNALGTSVRCVRD